MDSLNKPHILRKAAITQYQITAALGCCTPQHIADVAPPEKGHTQGKLFVHVLSQDFTLFPLPLFFAVSHSESPKYTSKGISLYIFQCIFTSNSSFPKARKCSHY